MSSEMRKLIRKEVEQWVGITRNRDIERSARVWMEGYDAALTYCADRISALLARTEAGADLRGGNVRFDVRLKNVEAGADGAEPFGWWIECHGTDGDFGQFVTDRAFVELLRSHGVVERETSLFTHPQDASGDAERHEMLRQVYGMASEGCESPMAGYRWCERIDELFHAGKPSEEYADYARDLPDAMQAKEAK